MTTQETKWRDKDTDDLYDTVVELVRAHGWEDRDGLWYPTDRPDAPGVALGDILGGFDLEEVRPYRVTLTGTLRVSLSDTVWAASEADAQRAGLALVDVVATSDFEAEPPSRTDFDTVVTALPSAPSEGGAA